ncbi:MAG: YggT family protein [Betaproteobacteria bacterium]
MAIVHVLVELVLQCLVGAALLRAWMNGLRLNMRVQPGLFVMALTDWLVQPLRRWMPRGMAKGRLDWGSLLAAVLLCAVYALVLLGLGAARSWMGALPGMALAFFCKTALQTWSLLLLGLVVLSWVQPGSVLYMSLSRVMAPLLAPLQRAIPLIGGVDVSPAVLMLLLQLLVMALP